MESLPDSYVEETFSDSHFNQLPVSYKRNRKTRNDDRVATREFMRSSPPPVPDDTSHADDSHYEAGSPASSEPAVFSSDGPMDSAGLDNYEQPRKKRKYTNLWAPRYSRREREEFGVSNWGSMFAPGHGEQAPRSSKKSKLSRNVDSGVWLPSDNSLDEVDEFIQSMSPQDPTPEPEPVVESLSDGVTQIIGQGLAHHREWYDLRDLGLEDDDLEPLSMLSTLIKPPLDPGNCVPGDEYYRHMNPSLHISLERNRLVHLHSSLFSLEHLTRLSIANNNIVELPPQIASFEKLELLDIRNNQIEVLPSTLLHLMRHSRRLLRVEYFNNPLQHRIPAVSDITWGDAPEPLSTDPALLPKRDFTKPADLWLEKHFQILQALGRLNDKNRCTMSFLGTTPPTYFDDRGRPLPGSFVQDKTKPEDVIIKLTGITYWNGARLTGLPAWPRLFKPPLSVQSSKIPSLLQLAANTALEHLAPSEAKALMQGDIPKFEDLCDAAKRNLAVTWKSFRTCDKCKSRFLVPRAEWIEFWYRPVDFFPFKVQVCSWECVPGEIAEL